MSILGALTDTYERKARLYPALVVVAPVIVSAVATQVAKWSALQAITSIAIACGGAFLCAQLARGEGKRREPWLFAVWGGKPSVTILRHRDRRLNAATKARYHKKLAALVKGTKAPTIEQEAADPVAADQVYEAWSQYLLANTRNTKTYALLFQENINYGYRRNLWGLRRVGIVTTLGCAAVAGFISVRQYRRSGTINEEIAAACAFSVVLLGLWVFRFTREWVRIPADAYADRLIEAVETMGGKR